MQPCKTRRPEGIAMLKRILGAIVCLVGAIALASAAYAVPKCVKNFRGTGENMIACDNGILRVRTTPVGIAWLDFFHPGEKRWYVNKNNLNHRILVKGFGW